MNEDPEGPFFKTVDWVNNRHADAKKIVAPAALENSLRYINLGFPETKSDPADAIAVMNAIWARVFEGYHISFENIQEFPNITKKPVIQRITEMVVDHLRQDRDPAFQVGDIMDNNAGQAAESAQKLIALIPVDFWKDAWALKSLDTSAGRDMISQGIRFLKIQRAKNPEPDFDWRKENPLYQKGSMEKDDDD
jgi:hypothetical protein